MMEAVTGSAAEFFFGTWRDEDDFDLSLKANEINLIPSQI